MKKLTDSDEFKDGLDLEGFVVKHPTFGIGTIIGSEGGGDLMRIFIKFEKGKARWLVASYANLQIISNVVSVQDFIESSSEQDESIPVSDISEEYQTNNTENEENDVDAELGTFKQLINTIWDYIGRVYVSLILIIGMSPLIFFFWIASQPGAQSQCLPLGSMC
tara:strand:+ start:33 stop:524 length:492 start_codon:yes stop_codon:yes gene_type:complete